MIGRLRDTVRKNSPELLGFLNGALPPFVTGRRGSQQLHGIPIYSYHVVEPKRFAADLEFLRKNGYRTLTLDELCERLQGRAPLGEREVALTFDDGPRNFHDVAFPLLRTYGFKGTVFIAPGLHAEDYGRFQNLPNRPMTWDEVLALHESGLVSVQSHTWQSQFAPRWPAPAPLAGVDPRIEHGLRKAPVPMAEDFRLARRMIEDRCRGASVRHLCFPMYLATPEAIEALESAGYTAGYGGLLPGKPMATPGMDLTVLPRLSGEFLRRMPGTGRVGLSDLLRFRIEDAAAARARARIYSSAPE